MSRITIEIPAGFLSKKDLAFFNRKFAALEKAIQKNEHHNFLKKNGKFLVKLEAALKMEGVTISE